MKIRVVGDGNEILLFVPYSERARAKRVPSFRWDPERRAWAYPRRSFVEDAIRHEFSPEELQWEMSGSAVGDSVVVPIGELDENTATTQELISHIERLSRECKKLNEQNLETNEELLETRARLIEVSERLIEETQKSIELFEIAEKHGFNLEGTDEDLADFIRVGLSSAEANSDLVSRAAVAEVRAEALLGELNELRARTGDTGLASETEIVSRIASSVSGEGRPLPLIDGFTLDEKGPIFLQTHLDKLLRKRVGRNRNERVSFVDLINEASDAQLLSRDANRLCHFIRVQRNLFAHEHVPQGEVRVRATLALMAFALVVREILQP